MAILTIIAALAATTAPGPVKEQPPRPVGDPSRWVVTDDYPPAAQQEGRSGITSTRLMIDAHGIPRHCSITRSSGHADLDQQACRSLLARAQFIPAVGRDGRNRSGMATRRVRWQLPEEDSGSLPQMDAPPGLIAMNGYVVSYIVQPDGRVTDCVVQALGAVPGADYPPPDCAALSQTPQTPATDAEGNRVSRQMVMTLLAMDIDPAVLPVPPAADD